MDIFDTAVLNRVVERLTTPTSFLLDNHFQGLQTETSEEIHFDIDKSKPKLAPFVSPLKAGKVMTEEGHQTKSFKPAYVKDKRKFMPNAPLRRMIGEQIAGTMTPAQRRERQVANSLALQLEGLTLREEVMASEVLRTGKATITGDGYPTVVVDFQRDAALTAALTSTARWGETGVKPLDDLESWIDLGQTKSGAPISRITMDPLAWRLFKADADVQKQLDSRRMSQSSTLEGGPINNKRLGRYVGTIGDLEFWVYQDVYVDETGTEQKMLPDYTVLGASERMEGTRCYGVIQDEEANYAAERYFSKSWLEKDPAIRWLLLQSAPLIVPYRPNASFCRTVR